ncbi:MAG: carboxypeptidase-like regulatory domain-containing protein [Sumerlaeia bacterium]
MHDLFMFRAASPFLLFITFPFAVLSIVIAQTSVVPAQRDQIPPQTISAVQKQAENSSPTPQESYLLEVVLQRENSTPIQNASFHLYENTQHKGLFTTNQEGFAKIILHSPVFHLVMNQDELLLHPQEILRFSPKQQDQDSIQQGLASISTDQIPSVGLFQAFGVLNESPNKLSRNQQSTLLRHYQSIIKYKTKGLILELMNQAHNSQPAAPSDESIFHDSPAGDRLTALVNLQFPARDVDLQLPFLQIAENATSQTIEILLISETGTPIPSANATLILTAAPSSDEPLIAYSFSRNQATGGAVRFSGVPEVGYGRIIAKADRRESISPLFSLSPEAGEIPERMMLRPVGQQLQGHIINRNGEPLAEVLVEAFSETELIAETSSDAQGYFTLWPVEAEVVLLRMSSARLTPEDTVLYERRLFLEFPPNSRDLIVPFDYLEIDDSLNP